MADMRELPVVPNLQQQLYTLLPIGSGLAQSWSRMDLIVWAQRPHWAAQPREA
jgi:hypothetical protein